MAHTRTIYVTNYDLQRLNKLIELLEEGPNARDRRYIEELDEELHRAKVVNPKDIPGDVVTMNSKVRVMDLDSQTEVVYELVFPGDADPSQNKVSILAPLGTALIGLRVGDRVAWEVPAGVKRLKVVDVLYQPEAAGDFHR